MRPKIDDLVQFEIFKGFKPGELADVANSLEVTLLEDGQPLFKEGDPGRSMFFIFKGAIRIQLASGEELAKLEAPTIFGEMAILEHKPRSATAVAVDSTVLWEMGEQTLVKLAVEGSPAAYKIMSWIAKGLSGKLRKTNETVHQLNSELQKQVAASRW